MEVGIWCVGNIVINSVNDDDEHDNDNNNDKAMMVIGVLVVSLLSLISLWLLQ